MSVLLYQRSILETSLPSEATVANRWTATATVATEQENHVPYIYSAPIQSRKSKALMLNERNDPGALPGDEAKGDCDGLS